MSAIRVPRTIAKMIEDNDNDNLIITPLFSEFLASWDGNISLKASEFVYEQLQAKQRDRRYSWSASASGFCKRRQELAFLGLPQIGTSDPRMQHILYNGRWVHLRWQAELLTAGLIDMAESTHIRKSLRARCTMDGTGVSQSGRFDGRDFGFELKGRNSFVYSQQGHLPDEKTRQQVDFEFLLTGMDLWVIINENKNDQKWHEWVFVRDESRMKIVLDELRELNKAIDREKLHPLLPDCKKGKGEFLRCPFGGKGGSCLASGTWPSL